MEADDTVKLEEDEEEAEVYLKKRVDDMSRELGEVQNKLLKAQNDNKALVKAAMS